MRSLVLGIKTRGLSRYSCQNLLIEIPLQLLDQEHQVLGHPPSQAVNPGQHLGPYLVAYRNLRHLKRHDPAMPDHLRSDLDQLGQ